jgi:putative two-component system response regulator
MNDGSNREFFVLESINKMALIAEHGLPNVQYHIQRMREYSNLLSTSLGMAEKDSKQIGLACMLHDTGMVSVPVSITSKASNLTNEEWDIVKQHPLIGAKFFEVTHNPVYQLAHTVSLSHHERWDGSGYPHGLKGEDIPLIGRICGLCDVFDTLTHQRAYKAAMSPDEVLRLIQECSETFFDPTIVDAFTLNYQKIIEIKEKYASPPLLEDEKNQEK